MLPLTFAAGAIALVVGIALVFVPAAVIVAGLILMAVAAGIAKAQEPPKPPGPSL
jgi:hypothetical protein